MNGPKSLKGGRTVREGVSISGTAAADLAHEMWRKTVWVVCSRMTDFFVLSSLRECHLQN